MKHAMLALSLIVPSTAAWAQQPVTPADLVGLVIKASLIEDRVSRREGRQGPVTRHQGDWTIEFPSELAIRATVTFTDYKPGTTEVARTLPPEGGGLVVLGRSSQVSNRGGGHTVWVFEAGVLTHLRVFFQGAVRHSFAVTRNDAGFSCTGRISYAREAGTRSIAVWRSNVNGVWLETVSAKQWGSSCKIGDVNVQPGAPVPTNHKEPPTKTDSKCFSFENRQFCEQ
jgi:hypothetical protein